MRKRFAIAESCRPAACASPARRSRAKSARDQIFACHIRIFYAKRPSYWSERVKTSEHRVTRRVRGRRRIRCHYLEVMSLTQRHERVGGPAARMRATVNRSHAGRSREHLDTARERVDAKYHMVDRKRLIARCERGRRRARSDKKSGAGERGRVKASDHRAVEVAVNSIANIHA